MLKMSSLLILSILIPFTLFTYSHACGISCYWGQNRLPDGSYGYEGSLSLGCREARYKYISIAFLSTFGGGQTPVLDLGDHCDPKQNTCQSMSSDISFCQSRGVKVLLSLGGSTGNYSITSPEDAREVASYLWHNYLSGSPGPLGNVTLDGIDFAIENPGSSSYWDELAKAIAAYSTQERKIYLSAAPKCNFPDRNLHWALLTGLFDYVYVQFYNNSWCDYSGGGVDNVLRVWNVLSLYSPYVPAGSELFLGLTADSSTSGYIDRYVVATEILTKIRTYANYGGVMLWNRYFDYNSGYYTQPLGPELCENSLTINHEGSLIKQVTF